MTTIAHSVSQTKQPDISLTTKKTENNIKRLKIYFSDETKDRSNIK